MIEFTEQEVHKYSQGPIAGTGFLAFRDVQKLLSELSLQPGKALDLGCGNVRSIATIKDLCSSIHRCEFDGSAIEKFQTQYPDIPVFANNTSAEHFPSQPYDSIFSFLRFFHFDSLASMRSELARCYHSLKPGGFLFIVHGNHSLSTANYASVGGVTPPPSVEGDKFKVKLKLVDLVVEDTYWTVETIQSECEKLGFQMQKIHQPLGEQADNQPYLDEYSVAPYTYLVLCK
ncbi:class I SAM-dependent methyltransferase [Vibrio sp. S4M6]|uniref:class I SAM-dependent methyltransferase n=1 Tax=Vibrio sinus TaxID=2946865 RepID=UPI00202A98CE|nr:class I SAM-dependent methyltransferase [Vibrio sinus]